MVDEIEEKTSKLLDIKYIFLTSIISALSLVVGLFWNDAIKSAIEQIVPKGEGVYYKFLAAVIVTVIVIAVIYVMARSQKIASEELKKLKKSAK